MTPRAQRRLALAGAAAALGLVLAANAHLVAVAVDSQPDCVAVDGGAAPAKRAC